MKNKILLFVLLLIQASAIAQPTVEWKKCLGGTKSDFGYYVEQTNDGGYIVGGESSSIDGDVTGNHDSLDYWIAKLDGSGNIQWQKSLGGSGNDYLGEIPQTSDGGYIAVGWSSSYDGDVTGIHGGNDYWVVKLNGTGDIQWQKCLGGSNNDYGYAIEETIDGGYILTGRTYSNDGDVSGNHGGADYWVVKINSVGAIEWQKCLGGLANELSTDIQQTSDSGYIVTGESMSNDSYVTGNHGGSFYGDYWVVKLGKTGTVEWKKCLGGSNDDWNTTVKQTTDGGYIIDGESKSNDGDVSGHHGSTATSDYWIVKLDGNGAIQWQKSYGGSDHEWPYSIDLTNDGGYVIAGVGKSVDGDVTGVNGYEDYWVVKINSVGNLEWQKCLGGTQGERAHHVEQTNDGGYIVTGNAVSNDGDVVGNHGSSDYWVVKLSSSVGIEDASQMEGTLNISPNPLTSSSILQMNTSVKNAEVVIYDIVGKEMMRKKMNGDRMVVERGGLESGVYVVRVREGEREWVEKVVVQ